MIKARASGSKVYLYFMKKGRQARHRIPRNSCSFFSMGGHLVYQSGTILAILVGSHRDNIPMKFESHWPKGSGVSF